MLFVFATFLTKRGAYVKLDYEKMRNVTRLRHYSIRTEHSRN